MAAGHCVGEAGRSSLGPGAASSCANCQGHSVTRRMTAQRSLRPTRMRAAAIDHAAFMALAAGSRQMDREAVAAALHALYLPWVEEAASTLQELVRQGKVKFARPVKAKAPDTILFVDGLRMDLAHSLLRLLAEEGVTGRLSWTWSGFPTVTATCKTLVSPIAHTLSGPATSRRATACRRPTESRQASPCSTKLCPLPGGKPRTH